MGALGFGCSLLSGPSEPTVYSLSRIALIPLPAPIDAFVDINGDVFVLEALSGTLTLFGDGKFESVEVARRTMNGVPITEPQTGKLTGTYERSDTVVVARFKDLQFGSAQSFLYRVFEGGRVLRGVESFGRVYEYVRQDGLE